VLFPRESTNIKSPEDEQSEDDSGETEYLWDPSDEQEEGEPKSKPKLNIESTVHPDKNSGGFQWLSERETVIFNKHGCDMSSQVWGF